MKTLLFSLFILASTPLFSQTPVPFDRIQTTLDSSRSGELTMIQEFIVLASVEEVWDAYTTEEGWEGWAVAKAAIDFRINGTIQTRYEPGNIGDPGTITTHIINYAPYRLLTLQADIEGNFPEVLKKDARDLYNVICFEPVNMATTRVISYGIGYKNTPELMSMMEFFIQGNAYSHQQLIQYLER
jgi:uncharacterized protein YndB with AHSA1/START domain